MTPERWQQVERIYQAALERDPASRSAFLEEACGGDAGMRQDVESLLLWDEQGETFLEEPALHVAARTFGEAPALEPGMRLGSYEVLSPLGVGGMGEVWRARDIELGRDVAVKVLPPAFSRDPERLRRFEQEARAAGMLNHPNVLAIYAIGTEGSTRYLVTELLEGETLRERLAGGPLAAGKAIHYALQLAQGLTAAHQKTLVHRDLKPENIFITEDDRIKILDFGLAKLTEPRPGFDQARTIAGMILGTAGYMSPEQALGQAADARSDIFSFGAIVHEMLSGRRAFPGSSVVETICAIVKDEPPELAGTPAPLMEIVRRCLEKRPESRFQSARELALRLEAAREAVVDRTEKVAGDAVSTARYAAVLDAPAETAEARRDALPRAVRLWRPGKRAVPIAAVVALAVAAAAWWLVKLSIERPPQISLTRLTSSAGQSTHPAISRDGNWLAYSSDRGPGGDFNIWIQPLRGGQPVQLTRHSANEINPDFSPDGTLIAYRSFRSGGGIYVMRTVGGEERLVADGGYGPRFSPDGKWIALTAGGRIVVVPSTGGQAHIVNAPLDSFQCPAWSPDGSHLIFLADANDNNFDWYVVPFDAARGEPSAKAIKLGVSEALRRAGQNGFDDFTCPSDWLGNEIIFTLKVEGVGNLWKIPISLDRWKPSGRPRQVLPGPGVSEARVLARPNEPARLLFATERRFVHIWSLPIAANEGKPLSPLVQLTQDVSLLPGIDGTRPSLSADGTKLAYTSNQKGNADIWVKELNSGREFALTDDPRPQDTPLLNADGTRVLSRCPESARQAYCLLDVEKRTVRKVCEDCGELKDWSFDGTRALYTTSRPGALFLLHLETGTSVELLKDQRFAVKEASLEPAGRWIAVAIQRIGEDLVRGFLVPLEGTKAGAPESWIPITEEPFHLSLHWSPNGNLLYFWSTRSEDFRCLWAQRLDPRTKRPKEKPFAVRHFHSVQRYPWLGGWVAVAADKLALNLSESTSTIWMATLTSGR
ncbi:MAG: serine/threonine-protein kinase [Acidobacteria bacterium]|nr:serine/threonine-protein kinase [Acidobacteriota bacterium]